MRDKKNKHLGLEIDPEMHYKLKYIAKYEDRSCNAQVISIIRNCIREFEKNVEVIEVPEEIMKG